MLSDTDDDDDGGVIIEKSLEELPIPNKTDTSIELSPSVNRPNYALKVRALNAAEVQSLRLTGAADGVAHQLVFFGGDQCKLAHWLSGCLVRLGTRQSMALSAFHLNQSYATADWHLIDSTEPRNEMCAGWQMLCGQRNGPDEETGNQPVLPCLASSSLSLSVSQTFTPPPDSV